MERKNKWDSAYQGADFSDAPISSLLKDNVYLLPQLSGPKGMALDLACGRAGNAQFLAKNKFSVDAIDISSVLIQGLEKYVVSQNLDINCQIRDIENDGLSDKKYDVIVVSYFLNRDLFPQIVNALKPNGLLYYQTWSKLQIDRKGPRNPEFRLDKGELLHLCEGLQIIYFRENGVEGNTSQGLRNETMIIAKKTSKQSQ
ncbi:MAG: class I SAM-dependent methyltransferase [Cocleimonas sp.]